MGEEIDFTDKLFDQIRHELYSAVVGDILDDLGFRHQFLPKEIQPLDPSFVIAGRAMPVLIANVSDTKNPSNPFGRLTEALDQLQQDEIWISTGSNGEYALWGELLSTTARKRGATGAVIDGPLRDSRGIIRMGFPAFCRGRYAQDMRLRGEVAEYRIPLKIGQVTIQPGMLIVGDIDGVVAVPKEAEKESLTKAFEKARGEKVVKRALEEGMSSTEAFKKYGIL